MSSSTWFRSQRLMSTWRKCFN